MRLQQKITAKVAWDGNSEEAVDLQPGDHLILWGSSDHPDGYCFRHNKLCYHSLTLPERKAIQDAE